MQATTRCSSRCRAAPAAQPSSALSPPPPPGAAVGEGAWLGVGDVVGVDGDEQEGEAAAREATLKKAPARTARRAQPNKARNAAEASTSGSIGRWATCV